MINEHIERWLERIGYSLGYDKDNVPELKYWSLIERLGIYAHTWYGYNDQEEYNWHENQEYRNYINKYEGS
tara:strand:- start:150 stop:362 length:213 start_codon:yes stop_codon:yes gene_type:complete